MKTVKAAWEQLDEEYSNLDISVASLLEDLDKLKKDPIENTENKNMILRMLIKAPSEDSVIKLVVCTE